MISEASEAINCLSGSRDGWLEGHAQPSRRIILEKTIGRFFSGFATQTPLRGVFQVAEPIALIPSGAPTAAWRGPCGGRGTAWGRDTT